MNVYIFFEMYLCTELQSNRAKQVWCFSVSCHLSSVYLL